MFATKSKNKNENRVVFYDFKNENRVVFYDFRYVFDVIFKK